MKRVLFREYYIRDNVSKVKLVLESVVLEVRIESVIL